MKKKRQSCEKKKKGASSHVSNKRAYVCGQVNSEACTCLEKHNRMDRSRQTIRKNEKEVTIKIDLIRNDDGAF